MDSMIALPSSVATKKLKKDIKLVIIGRTGAGKTTFINSVVNHFYGIEYDEERQIAITQEQFLIDPKTQKEIRIVLNCNMEEFKDKQTDIGGNLTLSQTKKSNIYDLENDEFKLTMIDTPGLVDTAGFEEDQQHIKNICEAVASLSDFHAVVLVHKANDCRKDASLAYLIAEFKNMLPKDCENNFLICFTSSVNTDNVPAIAPLNELGFRCNPGSYFVFENSALTPPSSILELHGIPTQNLSDSAKSCFGQAEVSQRFLGPQSRAI